MLPIEQARGAHSTIIDGPSAFRSLLAPTCDAPVWPMTDSSGSYWQLMLVARMAAGGKAASCEGQIMNPWIAKAVILVASVVMVAIRAPHGQRSRGVKVVKNRKGRQEVVLLTLAWLGFFVPLVWVASPAFSFAEYPLRLNPLIAGVVCLVVGLWLFYRSHAD